MTPVKWTIQTPLQTRVKGKRREKVEREKAQVDKFGVSQQGSTGRGKWESLEDSKVPRGTKMQRDVWRRWTDRPTMAMGRDETKESRAARRRRGRRKKQPQQKKRSYADKAFRGLTAQRWARPRSASHSIATLFFHSLAPEALRSNGDSNPTTTTQFPHHDINRRFMCRRTDFHNPFVFRRVPVKHQTQRQTSFGESPSPDFISSRGLFPISPVHVRW